MHYVIIHTVFYQIFFCHSLVVDRTILSTITVEGHEIIQHGRHGTGVLTISI